MIELIAVLGFPLLGGAALALVGHRDEAPAVNVAASTRPPASGKPSTARISITRPP